MKVAILAGGFGTRLSEYTSDVPKPMVRIGEFPVLLHIMNIYASYGHKDFVILAGYRAEAIKRFFSGLKDDLEDFTIDLSSGEKIFHNSERRDWRVTVLDTGLSTQTGGRILRAKSHLDNQPFMLTYGDGLSDVDLEALETQHYQSGMVGTLTAVRPVARFGEVHIDGGRVLRFAEKPQLDNGRISGGFFVFNPEVFDYLADDETILERDPLENLARDGKLGAYLHDGFWHCMDTKRDRDMLQNLWQTRPAPWEND